MSLLSLLPFLIILSGTYLLFKLRFFFILHPKSTLRFAFSGENKSKSTLSLMLALAGTLGVGNISGVAIGIAIGGSGSVFWLTLSALFSSAIKYSEVYLSYRSGNLGMIGVIRRTFLYSGGFFAATYALISVVLSFSMGSVFQARAIAESSALEGRSVILPLAPVLTLGTLFVCVLGERRIKRAVALIIPFAALIYTGSCLYVIFGNTERLPGVISNILKSAFSFKSASGGVFGFIVASGMKEGFARGLLSNEAGAGTSSFSHTSHSAISTTHSLSESEIAECERAGIFGILEVVFDTLLLCPLTSLAILVGFDGESFSGSLSELSYIFQSHVGPHAPTVLLLSIILFAVSTTLCWYYYGRVALFYLVKNRGIALYTALYFLSFFFALLYEIPHTLFITDTALFILSFISLSALIKNRAHLKYKDALRKSECDI